MYEKDINKKIPVMFAFSHPSSTSIHSKSAFIRKMTTVFSNGHEAHLGRKKVVLNYMI